jgi:nitrogen fixation/metabolism regulation signal transduction histidine kinase
MTSQHAGQLPADSIGELLSDKICELSEVHNVFMTVYDLYGHYSVSFNSDSLTTLRLPEQLDKNFTKRILDETNSAAIILPYPHDSKKNMAYWCYRDDYNKPIAIVSMLYVKEEDGEKQLYTFLYDIGYAYILLFLVGVVTAFFISRGITKPLKTLSNRLGALRFGSNNEPLEWRTNDEIGALIEEYNRMLVELEASASKLAQQERETAWREMAQQVAHEIKNPLTPMKLRMQHLQRTWSEKPEEFNQRLTEFVQSMSDQIDTLSRIAEEFSHFAKMPQPQLLEVNLTEISSNVVTTYDSENTSVHLYLHNKDHIHILGDKTQLVRIFNNLINNALQAIPDERQKNVTLSLRQGARGVIVKITDNGIGIVPEIKKRIFMPNFTTRSTGSGLGLAMVKSMVQLMGGDVAFRTVVDKGSSFFVFLPNKN